MMELTDDTVVKTGLCDAVTDFEMTIEDYTISVSLGNLSKHSIFFDDMLTSGTVEQGNAKDITDLDRGTLCELITKLGSREKATIAWHAVKTRSREGNDAEFNPCDLIVGFPIEHLSESETSFVASVLKDEHVLKCNACRDYVTERRHIHHKHCKEDINTRNCFKMRKLAAKYGAVHAIQHADEFISSNFAKVCLQEDFVEEVDEEDLLRYIDMIDRPCTINEFDRILDWIKHTERRHSIFPKLLSLSNPRNGFSQSLGDLSEFIHCGNVCYIICLVEIYPDEGIERAVNVFVQNNFAGIAQSQSIGHLSVHAMVRVASNANICKLHGGRYIWNAVNNWFTNQSMVVDDGRFAKIIQVIVFDDFDLQLLVEISRHELVRNSSQCCSKLNETLFCKMMKLDNSVRENVRKISTIDTRVRTQDSKLRDQETFSSYSSDKWNSMQLVLFFLAIFVAITWAWKDAVLSDVTSSLEKINSFELELGVLREKLGTYNESWLSYRNVTQTLHAEYNLSIDYMFSSFGNLSLQLHNVTQRVNNASASLKGLQKEIRILLDVVGACDGSSLFNPWKIIEIMKNLLQVVYKFVTFDY